ncbi:transcriptional regulator, TetR family [Luminiphilus syltensis NOR5-1B]|uniref:Transcriptional regulator, TetR family n=1 Tax=Luminiphilus syltensis NOR5-1B TaxID=565045 RepID=B8KQG4_9GAMM|nr:transcriptional regulator, TetR family [Luminiphilus syltensis NOR5-1B]
MFEALHDCVVAKGYNRTTLSDIAAKAGMTSSHLHYYFDNKDDILEQYFDNVSRRLLREIERLHEAPAALQIDRLADLWFSAETSAPSEIGFMLECFGAAVHDEKMRTAKAHFDREAKRHLATLIASSAGRGAALGKDGAEAAYAMMIGLRSSVYFDESMSLAQSQQIFIQSLRLIGRLDSRLSVDASEPRQA